MLPTLQILLELAQLLRCGGDQPLMPHAVSDLHGLALIDCDHRWFFISRWRWAWFWDTEAPGMVCEEGLARMGDASVIIQCNSALERRLKRDPSFSPFYTRTVHLLPCSKRKVVWGPDGLVPWCMRSGLSCVQIPAVIFPPFTVCFSTGPSLKKHFSVITQALYRENEHHISVFYVWGFTHLLKLSNDISF